MALAEGTPNLMQRLSRLPTAPHVDPLRTVRPGSFEVAQRDFKPLLRRDTSDILLLCVLGGLRRVPVLNPFHGVTSCTFFKSARLVPDQDVRMISPLNVRCGTSAYTARLAGLQHNSRTTSSKKLLAKSS
jgi:hypothetical protein